MEAKTKFNQNARKIKSKTKSKIKNKRELTRTEMIRTSVDEVHETSTAIELSEKNGSVSLRFRGLDPLQTRSNTAIFTATFAKYSATITTHPHFEQEQEWQNGSIKWEEAGDGEREIWGKRVLRI